MQEIPIDILPPDQKLKVHNSMEAFHEKFLEGVEFVADHLLIFDAEYQFVTNAEETLTLLLPSGPILERRKNT